MSSNSNQNRSLDWFFRTFFQDEPIQPPQVKTAKLKLPALLRQARDMRDPYIPREVLFCKQGKLLAQYEDDYAFHGNVQRYFPTYQSLEDDELRGYFSWRTQLRKGNLQKTCLSFAFLYIYELINQIGVDSPEDGFARLHAFRRDYGTLDEAVVPYLDQWILDYAVFYQMDSAQLSDHPPLRQNRNVAILSHIERYSDEELIAALKALSPKWMQRSRFYREYPQEMNTIIAHTLRRASDHYATKCKRGFVEQYLGSFEDRQIKLFSSAVFYEPRSRKSRTYQIDELTTYRKENGNWFVHRFTLYPDATRIQELIKGIDSIARDVWGYKHPIACDITTKWLLKIIREEAVALRAQQEAEEKNRIAFDFSRLNRIRSDAAETQEKLMVEEETDFADPLPVPTPAPAPPEKDTPLTPTQYRLLQCLLYRRDISWVRSEGLLLSVLVDAINEALYDTFADSVLDDTPALIEDYIPDLKEMILP